MEGLEVLESNEAAYRSRYGTSLRERWRALQGNGALTEEAIARHLSNLDASARLSRRTQIGENRELLLLVVMGVGSGDFLEQLRGMLSSVNRLIVYEPEELVFLLACCKYDLSGLLLDDRIRFVVQGGRELFKAVIRGQMNLSNVFHIGSVIVPGFEQAYQEEYARLCEEMKDLSGNVREKEAFHRYFGKKPCAHELYALSTLSESSTLLRLLSVMGTREIPIILVSAGPSLRKNMEQLRRAHGRALVIAVTHAMRTLMESGIMPDLVGAVDPEDQMALMEADGERSCRLLVSCVAQRELQEAYRGRCIYFAQSPMIPLPCLGLPGAGYSSGGSVATDIFSLLRSVGFRRFILVGQDLAYGEGGETHATGERTPEDARDASKERFVPGIYGGMLASRSDWYDFLQFYEREIAAHPEVRVIDATEGGARIAGTEVMSLRDAIDRECRAFYDVDGWFRSLSSAQTGEEQEALRERMRDSARQLEMLEEALGEALRLNGEIVAAMEGGDAAGQSYQEKCARYDELYQNIMDAPVMELLAYYCEGLIQDYLRDAVVYEQREDIMGKCGLERRFFAALSEELPSLRDYIRELF